ncbi:MAG: RAD55 family ATPase [Planctomycetia bacterium]|nr:RAD55 family ATPase [Planctomycetia bacterium]
MKNERLSTGIQKLDEYLGGGLFPGAMTVIVGSSGIGKTQLGIQFASAGLTQEKKRGIIFDMSTRMDAQGHEAYARRLTGWEIRPHAENNLIPYDYFFEPENQPGDYFRPFSYSGRRVTRQDMDFFDWNDWKAEITKHLTATISFAYGNFIRGVRRFIVDGIEPVTHQGDSIQFELLEYIYHQILRKDADWVARDLFRQLYLQHETQIHSHMYDKNNIGCMVLYTSPETSLDAIIEKPLDEGDLLAGANTIIYMGKIREGVKFRRAMYVAKHRGSICPDEILPYEIRENGIFLSDTDH